MLKMYFNAINEDLQQVIHHVGLLVLRVTFGLSMGLGHGLGKVNKVIAGDFTFADPIGLNPKISLILASGAEFFCSLLIVLGLFTRIATLPLIFTMCVAAFVVHDITDFNGVEKALLYLFAWVAILLAGPGKFSLDELLKRKFG